MFGSSDAEWIRREQLWMSMMSAPIERPDPGEGATAHSGEPEDGHDADVSADEGLVERPQPE